MSNSNNSIFCLAPWVHAHINVSGKRALCCQANGWPEPENSPFQEFWNNSKMKVARLAMMSGTPPKDLCQICISNKMTTATPNQFFNHYDFKYQDIIDQTDSDGTYHGLPVYYDYRLSNGCNLSCRMCNAESSSLIEKGVTKMSSTSQTIKDQLKFKKTMNNELIKPELLDAISTGHVEVIYWASGEAFMQSDHWDILNFCIEQGQAKKIKLLYNSNLAFPKSVMENKHHIFKQFKEIEILASIDGVGENLEFIRDGLKWNQFNTTFNYALNDQAFTLDKLKITLTIPTLLELKPFLQFLLQDKISYTIEICHNSGLSSLYSPLSLPNELLDQLIDHAQEDISSSSDQEYFQDFSNILTALRGRGTALDNSRSTLYLLNENNELDDIMGRKKLRDYYQNFEVMKNWLPSYYINYSKGEAKQFWQHKDSKLSANSSLFKITHNYQNIKEREIFFSAFSKSDSQESEVIPFNNIGILGSAPSLLNKYLSNKLDSQAEKFLMYQELVINEKQFLAQNPHLKIIESKHLGLFASLLKDKSFIFLAPLLDLFTYPFRKFLAFHYYVQLQVNHKDHLKDDDKEDQGE